MPDVRVSLVGGTVIDRVAFASALQQVVVEEFRRADGGMLDLEEVDIEYCDRVVVDRPIASIKVRITAHGTYQRLHDPDGLASRCRKKLTTHVGNATLDIGVLLPSIGYSSKEYDEAAAEHLLHGNTVFSSEGVYDLGPTS